MGYSNSKWRKILIILSIINLCFVLFARFSKVFATNNVSIDDFPPIPNEYTNQNFIIAKHPSTSNYYYLFVFDLGNNTNFVDAYTAGASNYISFPPGIGKYYRTEVNGGTSWTYRGNIDTTNHTDRYAFQYSEIVLSSVNIYDPTGTTIVFAKNYSSFYAPHFQNISEIEGSTFSDVIISRGDYSYDDYLYFHLLEITYVISDTNPTTYYYSDKIFALNKDSKYYYTYRGDTDNQYSYYAVPRSALGLNPNSSYLYVLTDSQEGFNNSSGILEEDESSGIYDVIESDTTGVITDNDSINDKIQNIDDTINDNTVSGDTETDIEDSLNFDNQNEGLNNLNNGFFSRLTTMLSNLLGYNLGEDTSVSIPLPNSNKSIVLHSIDIYNNVTGALRLIINAFWIYIFSFYMWKFINKIYIAVSTGNILDTFSSSGEAITNDML